MTDEDFQIGDSDAPDSEPSAAVIPIRKQDPLPSASSQWLTSLATNSEGRPRKNVGNCALILTKHAAWQKALRYDAFADRIICGDFPPLPQRPDQPRHRQPLPSPEPGDLTSEHEVYISLWLAHEYDINWDGGAIRSAIMYAAKQHAFHPLQDYLKACHVAWDNVPRLDAWMIDLLGVADTPYARRVTAMYMISAVARAFDPGCKVDHVLVLEGPQGMGKTTALEILFGKDWFLPELPDLENKDAMHLLAGCWCALADELSAIRGVRSVEKAKSFFSRTLDVYRPPYGKDCVRRPRSCVFAATTNAPEYLTDETGNRRYWALLCTGELDFDALRAVRDQLWGEAVFRYLAGEHWWPEGELRDAIAGEQAMRVVGDEWSCRLEATLRGVEFITVADCLTALGIEPKDWTTNDQQRIGRILTRLGWTLQRPRIDGRQVRRYYPAGQWVDPESPVESSDDTP